MENQEVADQKIHPALAMMAARPELFIRQGSIVASRRRCGSQTYGPYYRLIFRDGDRQQSIYLGLDGPLVEQARCALKNLQQHRLQCQIVDRLRRQALASLRVHKLNVDRMLCPYGLRMKGFEVRGWRTGTINGLLASFGSFRFRSCGLSAMRGMGGPRPKKRKSTVPRSPQERLQTFLEARDRKNRAGKQ